MLFSRFFVLFPSQFPPHLCIVIIIKATYNRVIDYGKCERRISIMVN
jgi:hypothetical protein